MALSTPTGRSALRLLLPPSSSRTCWKSRRQTHECPVPENSLRIIENPWKSTQTFSSVVCSACSTCRGSPSYILQRVEKSHGCLRLCCRTLVVNRVPFRSLVETLGVLELETIREVRLHHRGKFCSRSDLLQFFTRVGQMSNLGHLFMNDILWDFPADCFSLLSPLGHLQKLQLIFGCLSGQLQKMLRLVLASLLEGAEARIPGHVSGRCCVDAETSLDSFPSVSPQGHGWTQTAGRGPGGQPVAGGYHRRESCRSEIGVLSTHSFIHLVHAKQAVNRYETLNKIKVLSS